MFVDISGFTAMSERLARLGRLGAEEVTDLLNHTFSRLLAVAYEDDGSLLKFGGDALLLLFEGHDHAARAVHAASGMRRKLRELQPLATSAGQVRLRMSVGVHTGTIDLFLVGHRHRELFVACPTATTTVGMEAAANAGEVLVSPAVVEALGGRASFVEREPGFLLRGAPPLPLPHTRPAGDVDVTDAAGELLSEQVRSRLRSGVPEAEHRPAVVGFVKFVGIDDLLERDGAEVAADALEALIDAVDEAAALHDVCVLSTDVDANGGKVILTAGVPAAQEFDGERMLRVLQRLAGRDLPLPVKIGVHAGPVFAGVIGPPFRLTYTVIGDAVNTAARVMSRAAAGELLATVEVLERSQTRFAAEALAPFSVKGKKQPLTVYRVGEPLSVRRPGQDRPESRLVGRESELAMILDEEEAARAGSGRILQIVGPAGLGKSRLIREVLLRRPRTRSFVVGSSPYESATPYHVVGSLVRVALGLSGTVDEHELEAAVWRVAPPLVDLLPLIGDVAGVEVPDNSVTRELAAGYRARRATDAVCRVLEAALDEHCIVVLEDLHWVDPESSEVIAELVHSVSRTRWLLVLTSREILTLGVGVEPVGRVVELLPLPDEHARLMVFAAVEAGVVSIDRGRLLLEKAGGNPFFLQELLRSAHAGGDLPESVDVLIQSELDELPTNEREILGFASVLGTDIDLAILEATVGVGASEQCRLFEQLASFVEASGAGFRFRHALIREAAYGRIPFRRRRELHSAAAAALQRLAPERVDLLALHTFHARDWASARDFAVRAATAAASRFANLSASEHYRRAIEASRHLPDLPVEEVAETWERLGDVLLLAAAYDDAVGAYRAARSRSLDPVRDVRLSGKIGQVRERQGRFQAALRWLNRAIALGTENRSEEVARFLAEKALVKIRQGKPREANAIALRAIAAGGDPLSIARSAYMKVWSATLLGDDRLDEQRHVVELFDATGDLIGQSLAHQLVAMAAYYRGDWDEAVVAYERGASLRRKVGDEVAAAVSAGNVGELLSDQGHFDRARALLEECLAVCGAAGFRSSRHFAEMTLARLEARLGNFEEATALLDASIKGLEDMGMTSLLHDALQYQIELLVFQGDHDAALLRLEEVPPSAPSGVAARSLARLRLSVVAELERGNVAAARMLAADLDRSLDRDARDYETALSLVAVAAATGDARANATARAVLRRLGVVVPGELLVFGPKSTRAAAASVSAGEGLSAAG